ncbi:hypothetical protein QVD17_18936 [Tagetes erecta]|uniref:anthranilate synthase n=1 Tax=Tagetes erecta TaxID=13708 RepID=A0AAD8NPI2_TARER|nr:hypothetical protein QVD17_18936 [Tagetes erecta]
MSERDSFKRVEVLKSGVGNGVKFAANTVARCSGKFGNSSIIKHRSLEHPLEGRHRLLLLIRCIAASSLSVKNNNNCTNSIIVIDNYDSFTYNLCQCIGELGCNFEVYRNDEVTVDQLRRKNPRGIVISPGPDKGISVQTILELGPTVPLFGVCLGLQCIGEAFGGKIVRSPSGAVLGKSSLVYYNEDVEECLFSGLSNPFAAARYHRFVIDKDSFPNEALEITAWTDDGLVMAARHKVYTHLQGVQFHPESIITKEGKKIVRNFIKLIEKMEDDSQS